MLTQQVNPIQELPFFDYSGNTFKWNHWSSDDEKN